MDIDLIQCKNIILTMLISLWLPQLLITDALQVENNNTHSCENATDTDFFPNSWPSPMTFEPYELSPSSHMEFTPAVASSSPSLTSISLKETEKSRIKATPSSIIQISPELIEPTPTIIRYLISSLLPLDQPSPSSLLQSKDLSSHLSSAVYDDSLSPSLSSSMVAPAPLLSSNVQSTPINELINTRESISSYHVSSSLVQSSPVVNSVTSILSSSRIFNESVTFPLNASHTVHEIPAHHHHHGQQPSGTMLIDGSICRVNQTGSKNLPNGPLTTTITTNYDDETFVNNIKLPTTPLTSIELSSSLANPQDNNYVNTTERRNNLASAFKDLDWLHFLMIFLSVVVLIFCTLLTLIIWRKNRRLQNSLKSLNSSSGSFGQPSMDNTRLKTKNSIAKSINKVNTKENLVNWRKVSGPGSKRSFLGSHGGSAAGLNISGGCSATSGTIDSNHEFEYLSFDSPTSSLKLRTAEYRPRRPYSGFPNHALPGSQSRLELTKEKVIPIGELDEIAELSSNSSSHDTHHQHHLNHKHQQHQIPSSRVTYVTTKKEIIGDYENPLMRPGGVGIDEVDCSVRQLIQVHISEQTQNIIQAIRSELKKFNPITDTNVLSQSQSIPTQVKESTSTSDA